MDQQHRLVQFVHLEMSPAQPTRDHWSLIYVCMYNMPEFRNPVPPWGISGLKRCGGGGKKKKKKIYIVFV